MFIISRIYTDFLFLHPARAESIGHLPQGNYRNNTAQRLARLCQGALPCFIFVDVLFLLTPSLFIFVVVVAVHGALLVVVVRVVAVVASGRTGSSRRRTSSAFSALSTSPSSSSVRPFLLFFSLFFPHTISSIFGSFALICVNASMCSLRPSRTTATTATIPTTTDENRGETGAPCQAARVLLDKCRWDGSETFARTSFFLLFPLSSSSFLSSIQDPSPFCLTCPG